MVDVRPRSEVECWQVLDRTIALGCKPHHNIIDSESLRKIEHIRTPDPHSLAGELRLGPGVLGPKTNKQPA